jgi:integrase
MKIDLTDAFIRNAPAPARTLEIFDAACRGLTLRITKSGVRSFYFRYRVEGRSERLLLGRYGDIALKDARSKADGMRRSVASGENPQRHRRTAGERTFGRLMQRYLDEYARRHTKHADASEAILNKHVSPYWGTKDYTRIRRADVIELLERIVGAGSPVMANRVQSLVSSIFNFAIDNDLMTMHPAFRLRKRGVEKPRTRVLSDDEIKSLWVTCVKTPVTREVGLALRLVLVTACRRSEISGMTTDELSDDALTLPATRVKNKRTHYVPLSSLAQEIIREATALARGEEERRARREGRNVATSMAVFPGYGGVGVLSASALMLAMRRLTVTWKERATPHDTRRTAATRMAKAGVAPEIVAAVLGHVPTGVTRRHYDLYDRAAEKRAALQTWANILKGIIGG